MSEELLPSVLTTLKDRLFFRKQNSAVFSEQENGSDPGARI